MKNIFRFSIAILLVTVTCFATTVVRLELPQLVQQSDSIIQGRVENVSVQWNDRQRMAYTYVTVSVADPMKGARSRTVTIKQIGGRVGALSVTVAGMPQFTAGEEVIVFLKGQTDGTFSVLGLNQGKYEVSEDYAVSNVSGIDVYNPKTGRIDSPAYVAKAPVDVFKAKIRELLK